MQRTEGAGVHEELARARDATFALGIIAGDAVTVLFSLQSDERRRRRGRPSRSAGHVRRCVRGVLEIKSLPIFWTLDDANLYPTTGPS